MLQRIKITCAGLVQGIGFRPFLFHLAASLELSGFVCNTGWGVIAEFQGNAAILKDLPDKIQKQAPPSALLESMQVEILPVILNEAGFFIRQSISESFNTIIPYDQAICSKCLAEFYNPSHRHYMNFFISCTDCGPRYSLIRKLPYDRDNTAMDAFPLCPDCLEEYTNPANRRFHAQATTCRVCGPHYRIFSSENDEILSDHLRKSDQEIFDFSAKQILAGKIIALQGIGGFHLLCDPELAETVSRLKSSKKRDKKPLAVITKDLEALTSYCRLSPEEHAQFNSRQNPILLLKLNRTIFPNVTDGLHTIGVMRPYTAALHYILHKTGKNFIIATSGNLAGRPMAISFEGAKENLAEIADFIIYHDREIIRRCDDAVVLSINPPVIIRNGRGYAPFTFTPKTTLPDKLLAMGAEQKVTLAIHNKGKIIQSEYLGDLNTLEYRQAYDLAIEKFLSLQQFSPSIILHDLNPDYYSSTAALTLAKKAGVPTYAVQHHEAHIASVLLEHNLSSAIGFAYDGTGYGHDGTIWGGEGFWATPGQPMERFFHLEPFILPGGKKAIEEPSRLLYYFLRVIDPEFCFRFFSCNERLEAIYRSAAGSQYPLTSSLGRLFDAVAALLGCGFTNQYDAMLPMQLENMADYTETGLYSLELKQKNTLSVSPFEIMAALAKD